MYSELNFLSESWIRVKTNNADEAIENKTQGKSIESYMRLMTDAFKDYYRILKYGKWMTVEFSNPSAAIWNAIQTSIQKAGFMIASVCSFDKVHGGQKSMRYTTTVKEDLIITCYKPVLKGKSIVDNEDVLSLWEFVESHLCRLPIHLVVENKTTSIVERSAKILHDRMVSYYVQHNSSIPINLSEFQSGLKERFVERDGMFFTATQVAKYEEKKKNTEGFVPMGIIISDEANGIQWLKNELESKPQTYQELQPQWMQSLVGQRTGDVIPGLDKVLAENFIKEPDGKWRVPDANDEKDLEILRTKALLKEFNLCVEQASKPKSKIKEVRVEALRAGFKQCYIDKDFKTIIMVGDKIPENLLTEDEVLLQYYDIASSRV